MWETLNFPISSKQYQNFFIFTGSQIKTEFPDHSKFLSNSILEDQHCDQQSKIRLRKWNKSLRLTKNPNSTDNSDRFDIWLNKLVSSTKTDPVHSEWLHIETFHFFMVDKQGSRAGCKHKIKLRSYSVSFP